MNIAKLEIEPNACPLTEPLAMNGFVTSDLAVDVNVRNRTEIDLGTFGPFKIPPGGGFFFIKTNAMELQGVPRRILNNVGAIVLTLQAADGKVVGSLSLVTAIDDREGTFYRTIFSPFQ